MKRSELKDLIKECVREVVFESGVIKSIVTEVAQGLGSFTLNENRNREPEQVQQSKDVRKAVREQISRSLGNKTTPVAQNSKLANNPIFAGTQPLNEEVQSPGVDITNLPGIQNWGKIANRLDKKG